MKYKWSFIDNMYLVVLGYALYAIFSQYILRIGLWGDELALANHYFDSYTTFFHPLKSHQVAPLLFLIIEKTLFVTAQFFGGGYDYFLRIYPMLCGIGTVVLYYFMLVRYTQSKAIALFSFIILLTSEMFIYYTSEVKQYICELWCTVLLLYVYSFKNNSIKFTTIFCLTVLYCVLTSHVICYALLPLGVYDTYNLFSKYKLKIKELIHSSDFIQYVIMYGFSLLILVAYYYLFLHNHPTKDYMNDWWKKSFVTRENFFWLLQVNLQAMYPYMKFITLDMKIWVYILAAGLSSLLLLKNRFLFLFSFLMIGTHLLFSFFQLYPVANRLILYWMVCTSLFLGSLVYFVLIGVYWSADTILLLISLIYHPIKKAFCVLKNSAKSQFYTTTICVLGCLIIGYFCYAYVRYKIPIYLHRAPVKPIYQNLINKLKDNDIVILHNRGVGKYENLYANKNNFKYISVWDGSEKLDEIKTELAYDDFLKIPANKVIDYALYSSDFDSFDRIWLTVVDEKHKADIKKPLIENRIREQIKALKSNKKLEECHVVLDTTICLIDNF